MDTSYSDKIAALLGSHLERRSKVFTPQVHESSRPLEPTNKDTFVFMDGLPTDDEISNRTLIQVLVTTDNKNPIKRLL
jgi:hypothetical protein